MLMWQNFLRMIKIFLTKGSAQINMIWESVAVLSKRDSEYKGEVSIWYLMHNIINYLLFVCNYL